MRSGERTAYVRANWSSISLKVSVSRTIDTLPAGGSSKASVPARERVDTFIGITPQSLMYSGAAVSHSSTIFLRSTCSGLGSSCLPDLDDIVIRVTHVTANLHAMVLWLGQEFGPSPSPLLIRGLDVGDTNIQEAGNLIRVLRGTKRHVWFIVGWTATYIHNQPTIVRLDASGCS